MSATFLISLDLLLSTGSCPIDILCRINKMEPQHFPTLPCTSLALSNFTSHHLNSKARQQSFVLALSSLSFTHILTASPAGVAPNSTNSALKPRDLTRATPICYLSCASLPSLRQLLACWRPSRRLIQSRSRVPSSSRAVVLSSTSKVRLSPRSSGMAD